MATLSNLFGFVSNDELIEFLWIAAALIISFMIFFTIYKLISRALLAKAKNKKQRASVFMFLKILKYLFVFLIGIVVISVYFGSWNQMPVVLGFITVALGLALQKPISSVLAWVVIATRRPFSIGDRINIDDYKGDVQDITLTHIYLEEVGGSVDGEELSERAVIIPNSILFDKEIINYTSKNEYILDEIKTLITYESNLKHAEDIMILSTKEILEPIRDSFIKKYQKEPHIRLKFKESGVEVTVRYFSLISQRNEISTNITRVILNKVKKSKDVGIAYPHTEVLIRKT